MLQSEIIKCCIITVSADGNVQPLKIAGQYYVIDCYLKFREKRECCVGLFG